MDKGIPITKTGLVSRLGFYAERGELFLTTRITGTDADRIREEMRPRSRLVTVTHTSGFEPSEKLDPPVYFEPLRPTKSGTIRRAPAVGRTLLDGLAMRWCVTAW